MGTKSCLTRWLTMLGLVVLASAASAMSPEGRELIDIDRKLAGEKCRGLRDYIELLIAAGSGNAAKAAEIEKRTKAPRPPEIEALAKRRNAILQGNALKPEDVRPVQDARSRLEAFCPYEKEGVPHSLPPAPNDEVARDYVLAFAPRVLAKMRQCEVFYPARRGSLEKAWAASGLSKLAISELHAAVEDVRDWMKEGYGPALPGSKLDRDLQNPETNRIQAMVCDGLARDLQRVEAALPASFAAKHQRAK